ncbi:MAG: hypothetical protein NTV94_11175 [Planctomycetota bacterium]|nr:hypothetical protein [Planctomycetota bacterium]
MGPGDWVASVSAGVASVSYEPGVIAQTEQMTGVPVPRGLTTLQVPTTTPQVPRKLVWWFGGTWEPARKSLIVPLWFPILLVAGLSALAWRMDFAYRRRARIGCCTRCNYNRAGLPSAATCPECGAAGTASAKP